MLNTAEASVITQITNRRNDFPKALEVYDSLKIYGENVVVVEGQRWRHHRKIVSPPFSEKNNGLVWQETLDQTRTMVGRWFDTPEKPESRTLIDIADDAMRLSLHVISRAGFGVPLKWPKKGEEGTKMGEKLENGHTMTYTEALGSLLHNILWLLALPRGLLSMYYLFNSHFGAACIDLFDPEILPFKITKLAQRSYVEWGQYMGEMYDLKKSAVLSGDSPDQLDLMVAMIKNANVTSDPSTQTLTDTEILGNAFVFILAGHETTANSIHFSLVYLALNIASQRHLQRDLDSIFGTRQVSEWSYDNDVPKLFSSMAGAVMNEELRLAAPVVGVPKCTAPDSPQPLIVGGKKCTVPGNVYIQLITPATHRNPHQWPAGPPRDPSHPAHPISNRDNDLEEFKPERWILDTEAKRQAAKEAFANAEADGSSDSAAAAALGVNTASDTAPGLYKPPKGAYIPFSEGYRSCIGRRFAQIELLAAIAVIFKEYSVELAVDEWASDAEVEAMDTSQRHEVWEKAREKVETQLRDDMGSKITLQLQVGHVALRLVRRGKERFDFVCGFPLYSGPAPPLPPSPASPFFKFFLFWLAVSFLIIRSDEMSIKTVKEKLC